MTLKFTRPCITCVVDCSGVQWSVGGTCVEVKLPPNIDSSKVTAGYAGTTEKSPLRTSNDSPLYAECVQPTSTGKPAISYVLLHPGSTATVLDAPGSPAYSDRGRAVRRRSSSSSSDLRTLTDRLEQLGAVDVARLLTGSASADAVAWSSVTHRGCCISLPHSGKVK